MNTFAAMLTTVAIGWSTGAAADAPIASEQAGAPQDGVLVAQAWRDKLDAMKRKGGQQTDATTPKRRDKSGEDEEKDELPAGDCVTYPIGCGPGYTNPKLRGIDCGGRSEIGCLCWKDLASKEQCDAYRASKNRK